MIHSEFFDQRREAVASGERLSRLHGYFYTVSHELRADGSRDWLLCVFAVKAAA